MIDLKINFNKFYNILAFLVIFSENRILESSPEYILEKYERYCGGFNFLNTKEEYNWGLHPSLLNIIKEYESIWFSQIKSLKEKNNI